MRITKEEILKIGESLLQTQGFNGFSYKDISKQLGIKTSSIHYYFPTKEDLAIGLIQAYKKNLQHNLNLIDDKKISAISALLAYGNLYLNTLNNQNKFCLCGFMAVEKSSLSDKAIESLKDYFLCNLQWLEKTIALGINAHELEETVDPATSARLFLSVLEGGMFLARLNNVSIKLEDIIQNFLSLISKPKKYS
jgi:TetR/AcrR family transcriptional regulator, transcriptional repressor for nem operon